MYRRNFDGNRYFGGESEKTILHYNSFEFYMQMVATEDTQTEIQTTTDNAGAFEKLKQTLSSSLLTAQDKGKQYWKQCNIFSNLMTNRFRYWWNKKCIKYRRVHRLRPNRMPPIQRKHSHSNNNHNNSKRINQIKVVVATINRNRAKRRVVLVLVGFAWNHSSQTNSVKFASNASKRCAKIVPVTVN